MSFVLTEIFPIKLESTTNGTPISTESTKIASKNLLPKTIFTTEEIYQQNHDYGIIETDLEVQDAAASNRDIHLQNELAKMNIQGVLA